MDAQPDSLFSVHRLDAVRLTKETAPALQKLLEKCSDYFKMLDGRPAQKNAALKDMSDVPSGFDKENLFCIGLRRSNGTLAGVFLTLRHYPHPNQWYISLFLLDPAWRGLKIGGECYFAFEDWVKSQGAEGIQLAVVAPNERAMKFWENVGFILPRCYPPKRFGHKRHVLIEYEKSLLAEGQGAPPPGPPPRA